MNRQNTPSSHVRLKIDSGIIIQYKFAEKCFQ